MNHIVRKLQDAPAVQPAAPGGASAGMEIAIRVSAQSLSGQKKRAEVWGETSDGQTRNSRWEMLCDEGKRIGGEDSAPPPLAYFSAVIAF